MFQDPQGFLCPLPHHRLRPSFRILVPALTCPEQVMAPPGLLGALEKVPDPRTTRGVRFQLATLLTVGVCAMAIAGHNSLTAIAE
ncbi:transposase family protein [Streptomyces melanosporofaciens]|uniref:transposase family protein n=1 Tax=Streptomyces melanosporofaciens TaxID=67327 RepID=UPI000B84F35B|nr:transposase family protein [Streptomyces melanosporofaciens]